MQYRNIRWVSIAQKTVLSVVCLILLSNNAGVQDSEKNDSYTLIYYRFPLPQTYFYENLIVDKIPEISYMYKIANLYIPDYASFFIAIKMEESGADLKPSWLAKNHNNLTGMRYPTQRETYAIGSTQSNYAIYRNWFECMLDFKIYMELIEKSFEKKNQRKFKDDYEMLDYVFKYYNAFDKWYADMRYLIGYVQKNYVNKELRNRTDELLSTEVGENE